MPDVVLTAGLDTTEVTASMRKLQVESGLLAAQIDKAVAPATHENARLSEAVREVGHEVRGATRAFHHLVFAPVMIAGIAYEFFHLGGEIEEVAHKLLFGEHAATDFVTALDFTKPTEALDKLDKKLSEVDNNIDKILERKSKLGSAARWIVDTFVWSGGGTSGASTSGLEEEKEQYQRTRVGLVKARQAEIDKARFDQLSRDAKEIARRQEEETLSANYRLDKQEEAQKEHAAEQAARDEQRLQEETIREARRLEDEAFRDAQEQNARVWDEWLAKEREKQRIEKERQRDEEEFAREQSRIDDLAAQRSGFAGSSLAPGLFNASVGTGIFGLGSQSANNPQLAMHRTTNEKLDKANQTLASIERNTQNRAATFG